MWKKVSAIIFGCYFISMTAGAVQGKVKIAEGIFLDAYFRPRVELDAMDFNSNTGFDSYATFRTRLGISLENLVENTILCLNIADSRSMGYNDPYLQGSPVAPNKSDQNLGVDIAYLETRELFHCGTMLRIGRMENNQGRERLFGPGNWSVYGPRTYDGIKFGFEGENIDWHLWSLYGRYGDRHWYFNPETGTPDDAPIAGSDYKRDHTLNGIDVGLKPQVLQGKLDLMLYLDLNQQEVLDNIHNEKNAAWNRWTVAGYYNHKPAGKAGFNLDADAAYQFGKKGLSSGNADISAYMVFIEAGYKFDNRFSPTVGLGVDFISGDNGDEPFKVNNFYEYYYSAHTFQGHMDLFTGTEAIKNYGLQDFILRLGVTPAEKLKCRADIHYFKTEFGHPSAVDGDKVKTLGWETDVTADYDVQKGLRLRLGYDFFLPAEDWQGAGADVGTFIYCELTGSL